MLIILYLICLECHKISIKINYFSFCYRCSRILLIVKLIQYYQTFSMSIYLNFNQIHFSYEFDCKHNFYLYENYQINFTNFWMTSQNSHCTETMNLLSLFSQFGLNKIDFHCSEIYIFASSDILLNLFILLQNYLFLEVNFNYFFYIFMFDPLLHLYTSFYVSFNCLLSILLYQKNIQLRMFLSKGLYLLFLNLAESKNCIEAREDCSLSFFFLV